MRNRNNKSMQNFVENLRDEDSAWKTGVDINIKILQKQFVNI
jgi:hypothetical protein